MMSHDSLTGLPNRYHLSRFLRKAKADGTLSDYWIAVADIDDFKAINDTYGHNCGDYVLKELAEVLLQSEACTELCRWGGEEFVLLGPTGNDMSATCERLERLRKTIEGRQFWYEENRLNVTVTMGLAHYEGDLSIDEWVSKADKKLYQGKTNGKNQLVY